MAVRIKEIRKQKKQIENDIASALMQTQEKRIVLRGLYLYLEEPKTRTPVTMKRKLESVLSATGEISAPIIENVLEQFNEQPKNKKIKLKIKPFKLK
jgi:hypothetical protein